MAERSDQRPPWNEILRPEVKKPYYLYRVGDNPFAIENKFGAAVLFTLMSSELVHRGLRDNAAAAPEVPVLQLLNTLFEEGKILKNASYDCAIAEAKEQAALVVEQFALFHRDSNYNHPGLLWFLEHRISYDYTPQGAFIGRTLKLVKSPHEEGILLLSAPLPNLLGEEGVPETLLERSTDMKGSLVAYGLRLNQDPAHMLETFTEFELIHHLERVLGDERIKEITGFDRWWGKQGLYKEESFIDKILSGMTEQEAERLQLPILYGLINTVKLEGTMDEGSSSAKLHLSIEVPDKQLLVYKPEIDARRLDLVSPDINRWRVNLSVKPIVTEQTSHDDLVVIHDRARRFASEIGLPSEFL